VRLQPYTSISLEELRKVLGLESIKDTGGNVIQEPPLPISANFRQRALDTAIAEINKKTDLGVCPSVLRSLDIVLNPGLPE
jgi:hypothetical protein